MAFGIKKYLLILLSISFTSMLTGCGSRSSDFDEISVHEVENPLKACPDAPNCVRITIPLNDTLVTAYDKTVQAVREMKPYEIHLDPDNYRIESVFVVVLFSDDMVVQLSPGETGVTYVHIRSASRKGYSDLGVNRRRIKKFLDLVKR